MISNIAGGGEDIKRCCQFFDGMKIDGNKDLIIERLQQLAKVLPHPHLLPE
jgi:hypothetical protein